MAEPPFPTGRSLSDGPDARAERRPRSPHGRVPGARGRLELPNSTYVEVPNYGHVTSVFEVDRCPSVIVRRFVRTLDAGDTSCVDAISEHRVVLFAETAAGAPQASVASDADDSTARDRRAAYVTVEAIADVIDRWYAIPGYTGVGLYGGQFSMYNTSGLPVSSQTWNLKLNQLRWTEDVAAHGDRLDAARRGDGQDGDEDQGRRHRRRHAHHHVAHAGCRRAGEDQRDDRWSRGGPARAGPVVLLSDGDAVDAEPARRDPRVLRGRWRRRGPVVTARRVPRSDPAGPGGADRSSAPRARRRVPTRLRRSPRARPSAAPHEAAAYAMPLRVADVVAVLDDLGIDRADFVGISWGARLCFGIGEHAPERVRCLVTIGQQPYAIDADGPLARVVGEALGASRERGIVALVEAFEAIAGRYPDRWRERHYLRSDAAAMRAAWRAALAEGAVGNDLSSWRIRCLICVAADDVDFFERARRAAEEIPDAEFLPIPGTTTSASTPPRWGLLLPAVLRTLREPWR